MAGVMSAVRDAVGIATASDLSCLVLIDNGHQVRVGHVGEAHRGDAFQAEQFGGLDPAMSCDDVAILPDQHRIGKTEPPDALRNLLDLLFGMDQGIARIWMQARDRLR
jgi:hypothetical protein